MNSPTKAGPELDALVAEQVMGWRKIHVSGPHNYSDSSGPCEPYMLYTGIPPHFPADAFGNALIPTYSTSIAAAWEVVEKFTPVGIAVHCCRRAEWGDDKWKCLIGVSIGAVEGRADTAPHAICIAALKAVGMEVPK